MAFEQILAEWGLPAVFAGTVLEGDGVAFMGGVLAHRGLFPFEAAALASTAGGFAIDQIMFHIGRHLARFPRARRALGRPAARRITDWVRTHPDRICLSFRFLYGMKTLGALTIGAASVPPLRFAVLDLIGCLIWAHAVTALGFGAGQAIERIFGRLEIHRHLGVALAVAVVLIVLVAVPSRLLRRDRAKAGERDPAARGPRGGKEPRQ